MAHSCNIFSRKLPQLRYATIISLQVTTQHGQMMYKYLVLAAVSSFWLQVQAGRFTEVSKSNNKFAINLYKLLAKHNRNLFVSPLSISTALAMTSIGATGETKKEMDKVLHFDTIKDVHKKFKKLNDSLYKKEKNYILTAANKLFGRKDTKFENDFLKKCKDNYNAGAEELDFVNEPEPSRVLINKWVEEKTMDKIKDLFGKGSITERTIMVLVNAIYFKGDWHNPFQIHDTKHRMFNLSATSYQNVETMYTKARFTISDSTDLSARILEMNYQGWKLSMFILLPHGEPGQGLDELEKKLSVTNLEKAMTAHRNAMTGEVKVYMPKFRIESEFSLSEQLKELGMKKLFSPEAELRNMSKMEQIQIDAVKHKTFINVNEYGTEAAAATGGMGGAGSVQRNPPIFRVDRPFLFFIRADDSNSLVFMGRMKRFPGEVYGEVLTTTTTMRPTPTTSEVYDEVPTTTTTLPFINTTGEVSDEFINTTTTLPLTNTTGEVYDEVLTTTTTLPPNPTSGATSYCPVAISLIVTFISAFVN